MKMKFNDSLKIATMAIVLLPWACSRVEETDGPSNHFTQEHGSEYLITPVTMVDTVDGIPLEREHINVPQYDSMVCDTNPLADDDLSSAFLLEYEPTWVLDSSVELCFFFTNGEVNSAVVVKDNRTQMASIYVNGALRWSRPYNGNWQYNPEAGSKPVIKDKYWKWSAYMKKDAPWKALNGWVMIDRLYNR